MTRDCEYRFMKKRIDKDLGELVEFYCRIDEDECNLIGEKTRLKCGIRKSMIGRGYKMKCIKCNKYFKVKHGQRRVCDRCQGKKQ